MSDIEYIYRHMSPELATVEEQIRSEIRPWLETKTSQYLSDFQYAIECNLTDQAISAEDWRELERLETCHALITSILDERSRRYVGR